MKVVLHRDPFHDDRAEPAGFGFDDFGGGDGDGDAGMARMSPFKLNTTTTTEVFVPEGEPFNGSVLVDGTEIAFKLEGVSDADELHVRFTSATHAVAKVTHAGGKPPNCRAICADGTEGTPCVKCRNGNVTSEICC